MNRTAPRSISSFVLSRRCLLWLTALVVALLTLACENTAKLSAQRATVHAEHLANVVTQDVKEIRSGLPEGAQLMSKQVQTDAELTKDPEAVRAALESVRNRVQDLRVAKSTFLALLTPDGEVIRNDRDTDLMAGKNMFEAFPKLKDARTGKYVEAVGSMHEARGVEGKPDGQWVAAQGLAPSETPAGVLVTGWAWSVYARRLEAALRTHILDSEKDGPEPLVYVFIVAEGKAYGAAAAPEVNAQAIEKLSPSKLLGDAKVASSELEITGRSFGLALTRSEVLGDNVMLAVLRSET